MELDDSTSPSEGEEDGSIDVPQPSSKLGRCEPCRAGYTKCDGQTPVCGPCARKNTRCIFSVTPTARASLSGYTSRSCLMCRIKKKACGRELPSCASCIQRNVICQYDYAPISRVQMRKPGQLANLNPSGRPAKSPRLSMPARPADRKRPLTQMDDRRQPNKGSSVISDDISDSETDVRSTAKSASVTSTDLLQLFQRSPKKDMEPRSNSIEVMENGTPGTMDSDMQDTSTWLAELKEAILHRTDMSKPGYGTQAKRELARLSQTQKDNPGIMDITPDKGDLTMPPRKVADRLLAVYLTREYVNLPIFHLPVFRAQYTKIYTSEKARDDKAIHHALLNVTFALGSIATDPNNHFDASMYFIRAQRLLRLGSLGTDSLATIQAHILVSQYLIAINNFRAAWKSIGLAIRIAETLRLHLAAGSQHYEDRVDRELARRLWHSCILLERTIALSLGSTTIVTPRSFQAPLPTPLENEYVDVIFGGTPAESSERPSIIEFFTASTRLMERYEDIVAVQEAFRPIISHPHKLMDTCEFTNLLTADRRLCNWMTALPPFLLPGSTHSSLENPVAKRQHNILRIRYLTIRLLLWRPLLALVAASPDLIHSTASSDNPDKASEVIDTPIIHTIISSGACKCILSAQEIINFLTESRLPNGKIDHQAPLPVWWENVTSVFTCALIFLAARLCPVELHKQLPGGSDSIEVGWKRCIELFNEYRTFNSKAGTYLIAIESLATSVAEIASTDVSRANDKESDSPRINDVTWLETLPDDLPCLV
ncbi:fungal specific transcription factor domain-containing protein [Nannizzia gypsea CBS 118893]|uniref:Fungal specific transcription factor domain-containing protein n=1 Tax=Arthroderma gypseum (strain ATCC MYA-4604 / CBS 118893) TaxID=535722 RepID=E4UTQ9_ARTGP|nr:fungal specific transcription factor domain-containing protein [Nannizzia gypsea CBS 118893]EFR01552.1 fungal specific transcription factor domain-containing protein [Nannizzia gypsea CBS 118893]